MTDSINFALSDKRVSDFIEEKRKQLKRDVFAIHAAYVPVNNPNYQFLIKIYFDFWDENYRLYNEDIEVFVAIDKADNFIVAHWQHTDK